MDTWLWSAKCSKCGKTFLVGRDAVTPGQETEEHGAELAKKYAAAHPVTYCSNCGHENRPAELGVNRITVRVGAGMGP